MLNLNKDNQWILKMMFWDQICGNTENNNFPREYLNKLTQKYFLATAILYVCLFYVIN